MLPLTERLSELQVDLTKRVVAQMYQNPFWRHRFGERGRVHSENDGQYHVTYLVTAIRMDSIEIMQQYATWLRGVLVHRGMCSRHLAENFERIAFEIERMGLPDAHIASRYLNAAVTSLTYDSGAAKDIQVAEHELVMETERALRSERGSKRMMRTLPGIDGPDDLRYLVSFLSDSLAFEDDSILTGHIAWQCQFLRQYDYPADISEMLLHALSSSIEQFIDNADSQRVQMNLQRSRDAISGGSR